MNTTPPHGLPASANPADWDPIKVRDLVRQARAKGLQPALLELGRDESFALRRYLADAYGEEGAFIAKDTYYLGLEVVEVNTPQHLVVTGRKAGPDDGLPPLWTDSPGHAA